MKTYIVALTACFIALCAHAGEHPNFAGNWDFKPEKSANIGMMAQMQMLLAVQQSDAALDLTTHSTFQGKESEGKTHLDLTGAAVTNETPMGGPNETVTHWQDQKLVTTWTGAGAVSGSKVVRTETRSLSPDAKVMTVESVRGSAPALVMVFERK